MTTTLDGVRRLVRYLTEDVYGEPGHDPRFKRARLFGTVHRRLEPTRLFAWWDRAPLDWLTGKVFEAHRWAFDTATETGGDLARFPEFVFDVTEPFTDDLEAFDIGRCPYALGTYPAGWACGACHEEPVCVTSGPFPVYRPGFLDLAEQAVEVTTGRRR